MFFVEEMGVFIAGVKWGGEVRERTAEPYLYSIESPLSLCSFCLLFHRPRALGTDE